MKSLIVSALIFFLSIVKIKSNILGIDFGSELIKITVLKPNSSFKMVENIQSKTKTPAALAFKDEERLFGSDALGKKVRFPKQVFVSMHEFLGKKYKSKQVRKFIEDFFVSYDTEEDHERKTFNFKVNFNHENYVFSIEEIFGMLFRYIKFLSDKYSETNTKDCVVTVPAFFGYRERLAISQAVELSDLNLQALITENSAAAVQYSTDKQFNKTETVIFYNMGSSYTQATLVSFNSTFEYINNKTVEVKRKISVLAESWDKSASGNTMNYNFIRHLMKQFDSLESRKNKPSVLKDYYVAERLLPAVVKYKEILSANKFTPINILGVENGENLKGKINREEFELINKEVFQRIFNPIEKLLKISGLNIEDISQIELLGGTVRIPKIQEVLRNKVNASLIGQHMNGDDSMALGACFVSANYSNLIKSGKIIELNHGANYGMKIKIRNLKIEEIRQRAGNNTLTYCVEEDELNDIKHITIDCIRKFYKNATLFEVRSLAETEKKISLKYDNDLELKVYQFFEEENIYELNKEEIAENSFILNIKVKGIKGAVDFFKKENITSLPRIELKFHLDRKGLLSLKAEAINFIDLYLNLAKSPAGEIEFIYTPELVEPYNLILLEDELKQLNKTGANQTLISLVKMKKDIGKKKTQELQRELTVEMDYIGIKPMNAKQIQESRIKLDALDQFDEIRIKTMDARNNLESEIYKRRDWLEDENFKNVFK
jgi:hypoxia up-regulated 1